MKDSRHGVLFKKIIYFFNPYHNAELSQDKRLADEHVDIIIRRFPEELQERAINETAASVGIKFPQLAECIILEWESRKQISSEQQLVKSVDRSEMESLE